MRNSSSCQVMEVVGWEASECHCKRAAPGILTVMEMYILTISISKLVVILCYTYARYCHFEFGKGYIESLTTAFEFKLSQKVFLKKYKDRVTST